MKTIMLLVHDDAGQEARLQAALDLARAFGAHLTCIDLLDILAIPAFAGGYDAGSALLAGELRERHETFRQQFQDRLSREDVTWEWREASGDSAGALADEAGLADLFVISSRYGAEREDLARYLDTHLAKALDCPVLAVPAELAKFNLEGTALVAWDGSEEANRALRQAVPLLKRANCVVLAYVDPDEGDFAADSAAAYLSRHGIDVEVEAAGVARGQSISDRILARAREIDAGYIVMGAFGRPPLVEAVLGGVSRSMVIESPVPLMLAG